jgi:predicted nicotinamide N-methyase
MFLLSISGGLVGLSSGIIGAYKVIMTDLKYALPLMLENVKRNESSWRGIDQGCKTIECKECDWFRPPPISELFGNNSVPDVILVADCVWLAPLIAPLLRTLETYTDDSTTVIITYQQRGKDAHEEFWEGIHHMFDVVAVDTERTVGLAKPDVFHVLECKKISI